ncbi:MAG: hypothetical protein JST54_08950 [Deltaproteobacteria bacterium]|nr:hypothetical protein [Deltaproteobacteria bacterium]
MLLGAKPQPTPALEALLGKTHEQLSQKLCSDPQGLTKLRTDPNNGHPVELWRCHGFRSALAPDSALTLYFEDGKVALAMATAGAKDAAEATSSFDAAAAKLRKLACQKREDRELSVAVQDCKDGPKFEVLTHVTMPDPDQPDGHRHGLVLQATTDPGTAQRLGKLFH